MYDAFERKEWFVKIWKKKNNIYEYMLPLEMAKYADEV